MMEIMAHISLKIECKCERQTTKLEQSLRTRINNFNFFFHALFMCDRVACMWRDGSRISPFQANANEIQLTTMNCCE